MPPLQQASYNVSYRTHTRSTFYLIGHEFQYHKVVKRIEDY
jgi:hypothetical protein